jgi:hypothetical protein
VVGPFYKGRAMTTKKNEFVIVAQNLSQTIRHLMFEFKLTPNAVKSMVAGICVALQLEQVSRQKAKDIHLKK